MEELKNTETVEESENKVEQPSDKASEETTLEEEQKYSTFDKFKADVIITANQASNMSNKEKVQFVDKKAEDIAEKIGNSIDNFLEKLFKRKKKN